jgi:hypothetical protein
VLCRWRQEEAAASPGFVHVEIVAALGADEQSGHDPAAAWRENESGVWLHGNAQGDRWNGRDFYSPDRRAKYTAAHLGRFRGVLQLDGYAGFAALPAGTTALAACWEHARRRFYDVQQATGSPIAAEAFLITH